jgi:hypothetical protein
MVPTTNNRSITPETRHVIGGLQTVEHLVELCLGAVRHAFDELQGGKPSKHGDARSESH